MIIFSKTSEKIKSNPLGMFETMREIQNEYDFSPHFVRKYRDKNIKIEEKHLGENKQLLGCIIESL
jgi:hypothetical protein